MDGLAAASRWLRSGRAEARARVEHGPANRRPGAKMDETSAGQTGPPAGGAGQ